MNRKTVERILREGAYVRTGGTEAELLSAQYLQNECAKMGLEARLEAFPVMMYEETCARLLVDGREISCKGFFGAPSGTVRGELFYLTGTDRVSARKCKGKIVLADQNLGWKLHDFLVKNGAIGVITYSGNIHFSDTDIDRREYRFSSETYLPAVNIHVSDAIAIVEGECREAEITIEQSATVGTSHNVILDLAGESDETVVISAHYDSTLLSSGAYDNLSGAIGLLYLAELFANKPLRRNVRLLWCGSEERGLLGSLAYCEMHESELPKTVMNINLDMLGSIMGEFVIFSCGNEELTEYLEAFASKHRVCASVRHAIRSSDSNSFVYYGVPAVSFARYANSATALIHTRYDTVRVMSAKRLLDDMRVVGLFAEIAVNAALFPTSLEISERIRTDTEEYMQRKKTISPNA